MNGGGGEQNLVRERGGGEMSIIVEKEKGREVVSRWGETMMVVGNDGFLLMVAMGSG
jgi:hypothetical protein